MSRRVLVVGSGAREHAMCWKLAQSEQVSTIYCAPGNGGTATSAKTQNVAIGVQDFEALIAFAVDNAIDLTVVGPDNPLAEGIVDTFRAAGLKIFGPTKQAAQLESSKAFAKRFMQANHLPTAQFEVFDAPEPAMAFCRQHEWARVIKVDGLALGKGVFVCDTLADCEAALATIFETQHFGNAGRCVVVEERLHGPEVSLMVLCDGQTIAPFESSQDYKRRFENDQGPNTGGMGAFSPVPDYSQRRGLVQSTILTPLQTALAKADFTFTGVLFLGLLIHENRPYLLEFNARFGDPETQCLLPRLQTDFYTLLTACVEGRLSDVPLCWSRQAAVGVVLCGESYPESGSKDQPIQIDALPPGSLVFHAGTRQDDELGLVTAGGRVMTVVALGETHAKARAQAYQAVEAIHFSDKACRQDIAEREAAVCSV